MCPGFSPVVLPVVLPNTQNISKSYVGMGPLTLVKRKPGVMVVKVIKANNRVTNRLRSVVEWVTAQVRHGGCCNGLSGGGEVICDDLS